MDQHAQTPGVVDAGGRNPLTDLRVRKALSLAINRQALADRTLSGLAEPAAELGSPSLFGANPDAVPDPYDPAGAKSLLAEAGYTEGFGIKLATPNGLYASDTQLAAAIASMWTHAGIRTDVDSMPGSVFYARRNKLEFSAYVTFYCDYNGQMSYPLRLLSMTRDLGHGYGQVNVSGFSDTKLDSTLVQALQTLDDNARRKLVQEASRYVLRDKYQILPIVRLRYAYAVRPGLQFRTRLDTFLTAMQVSPAK
jgi:peptide/nickel transport system substrate-binding protein